MNRLYLAVLASLISPPAIAEPSLNILNWSEYIDRSVLPEFTEVTGIPVTYDTYDEGDTTEARLLARGTGYDLVVVSSEYLSRLIEAEAIIPFDRDALTGLSRLDPRLVAQLALHDPSERYSVPYMWGTTGLGYNAREIAARMPNAPIDSWRMIFDPEIISRFADCGVTITDTPEQVFAIALNFLGHDPNSTDPSHIAEAVELIRNISPFVKYFGTDQVEHLASGQVCLALAWSGDVLLAVDAQEGDMDIRYVVPSEGAPVWFDLFVLPADAANPGAAHKFVEFQLRPEIIARSTNEVWYPNPNAVSLEYVDAEVRTNPAVYPPGESWDRLYPVRARSARAKQALVRTWRKLQLGL